MLTVEVSALRKRWAALIAVASGLVGVLAFPRFGIWPLAFLSVAGLSIAVHGRRSRTAAWIGLVYGAAFMVPLLKWTGIYVGPAPWLILAAAEAGYFAGLGAILPLLQRMRGAPVWVACAWVLEEAVRDRWPFGGFPWGRLAFSQAESPMKWFAPLGGMPLISFVVALGGALLAAAVLRVHRLQWRPVAVLAALAVATPVLGALLQLPLKPAGDRSGVTTTIAMIQGNVPRMGLSIEDQREQVLNNHLNQTLALAADITAGRVARPQLVVWPENASDIDPLNTPAAGQRITAAAQAVGAPILVGAILDGPGPDHVTNAGILWSPTTGPGVQYAKRHPVPFAEYIPLRSIARLVSSDVNLVERDMIKGHGNGLMTGGPYPLGDVICFEVAYDSLVRSSVQAGAQLLVVQTNNATFGHTAETYQQLAMTQLRAIETDRTTVQVATSGKSAIVGPDGSIRAQSGALFTADRIVLTVPLRTSLTLAMRLGPLPEYVLSGIALLLVAGAVATGLRARRAGGGPIVPGHGEAGPDVPAPLQMSQY